MGKNGGKEYEIAIKIAGEMEKSFGNAMGMTRRELRKITRDAISSNQSIRQQMSSAFDTVNGGMERISSVAKEALELTAKISAAGLTAASAAGAYAVKVGSSYEAQMSTVQAISMASAEDMKILGDKAKEMGATTVFSASQAGEAMEYMAMAGWKTQDMVNGIGGIMNLAAASGEDLGAVSDIVTDALTAFGLSAADSGHFADVLAAASSNANTNVSMMGETFKYVAPVAGAMKYSVEDTAEVIGLMANSGIKASQAGTILRAILSRMVRPTDEVAAAMKRVGVELTIDGKMKALNETVSDLRNGFAGLSDEEKTQVASALAGQEAMSGLLAIVNASDADVNKLAESINNCTGAAEKMAQIRIDNLKGDATLFASAAEGLGISAFDDMNPLLRSGTQLATSYVNNAREYLESTGILSDTFDNLNQKLPTFVREAKEAGREIKEISEPLLTTGEWLADHPDIVKSTLVGIGTTLVSFKIASKIKEVTGAIQAMNLAMKANPWTLAISAIGVGIGAFSAIRTEIKETRKELKNANLSEHFGDITLSMEELEDVSQRIVRTDTFGQFSQSLEELGKADTLSQSIEDTIAALNKTEWEVSIGLKLSDDEKSEYQQNIASYIQQTQDLLLQKQYAVSMNLELFTDDSTIGAGIREKTNEFYSSNYSTLQDLGTKLQDAVNSAFEDGFLDIDEVKEIQELQTQIAEMQSMLADSKSKAAYDALDVEFGGVELDADTFQNLQEKIAEIAENDAKTYNEAYSTAMSEYHTELDSGWITEDEFTVRKAQADAKYLQELAQSTDNAMSYEVQAISKQYSDELDKALPELQNKTAFAIQDIIDSPNTVSWDGFFRDLTEGNGLDQATKDALADLYKYLEPNVEQMESLRSQYIEAGMEFPQALSEGLTNAEMLGMLAGDADAMYMYLSDAIMDSPDKFNIYQAMVDAGIFIPDPLKDAIEAAKTEAKTALSGLLQSMKQNAMELFGAGIDINVPVRTSYDLQAGAPLSNAAISNLQSQSLDWVGASSRSSSGRSKSTSKTTTKTTTKTRTKNSGSKNTSGKMRSGLQRNAVGGIFDTPQVGWYAEAGSSEALIPLDGSKRAVSLWEQAGLLLGVPSGAESKEDKTFRPTVSGSGSSEKEADAQTVQIIFSPVYHFEGDTSKPEVQDAVKMSFEDFKKMMGQYIRENKRLTF